MRSSVPAILAAAMLGGTGLAAAAPVYLNNSRMDVALTHPSQLTGGSLSNVSNAPNASAAEFHNQTSHVWVSGSHAEMRLSLDNLYNLQTLHFWNYHTETYDVDRIQLTFFDGTQNPVGGFQASPALGGSGGDSQPIYAEHFLLGTVNGVRYVTAVLSGTNNQVDFQNIGFTGTVVPVPAAAWLLLPALGLLAGLARAGRGRST